VITGNTTDGAAISFLSSITRVHGEEVSTETGGEEKQRRGTELHEIEFVTRELTRSQCQALSTKLCGLNLDALFLSRPTEPTDHPANASNVC
jgi:hypothetical protein